MREPTTFSRSLLLLAPLALTLASGCSSRSGSGGGGGITLSGTVVIIGVSPFPTVMAEVLGQGKTPVSVAPDGTFSITGVTTPYNLAVYLADDSDAQVYLGLTRPDPTLDLIGVPFTANSATVSATITGGTTLPDPTVSTHYTQFGAADGSITSVTALWNGASAQNMNVNVVQYHKTATGAPVKFTGFGTTTLAAGNGGTFTGVTVGLSTSASLPTFTVNGTYTLPTFLPGSQTRVTVLSRLGGSTANPLLGLAFLNTTGSFSLAAPAVPSATFFAGALVQSTNLSAAGAFTSDAASQVSATNATATLAIPMPLALTGPSSGSSLAPGTNFTFTTPTSSITRITLQSATTRIGLASAASTLTLPDLTEIGLGPLPTGTWTASAIANGPFTSLDQGAGPTIFIVQGPQSFSTGIPVTAGPTYNTP